jgi:hypothetical protein
MTMWKELYFRPAKADEVLGDSIMALQDEGTGDIAVVIHKGSGTPNAKVANYLFPAEDAAALAVALSTATFPFLPTNRS